MRSVSLHDRKSEALHTFVHKETHPMVEVHFLLIRDKVHIEIEATVCIPAFSMSPLHSDNCVRSVMTTHIGSSQSCQCLTEHAQSTLAGEVDFARRFLL